MQVCHGDDFTGLKNSIKTVIDRFQPTVLAVYHLTAIKGTKVYDLVETPTENQWLKIDENSQAISSNSYSEYEFKQMAEYATSITSLYNLLKRLFPEKTIDFTKLETFVLNNKETLDSTYLCNFDEGYATRTWENILRGVNHEKANAYETLPITRE